MYITKKMPSFEGVARGSTATCRLPVGLSYHTLWLTYSGFSRQRIEEIRLVANGKIFQRYSSADLLNDQNMFVGRSDSGTATSGQIAIDFIRHGCRTLEGEIITLLGTGAHPVVGEDGQQSVEIVNLSVEVDLQNSTGVTAPKIEAHAVQSDAVNLGIIKHVREFTYNPSAVGDFEIVDIPRGHLFDKLFFKSAFIDHLTVERDGYIAFERSADLQNKIYSDSQYRNNRAVYFIFDPTENGFGSQTFETADVFDLRFRLNMRAAGEVKVILHSLGPLV